MNEIVFAPLFLAIYGGIFSLFLAISYFLLRTKADPKVDVVEKILPGLNCGACGYASCHAYAKALVYEDAPLGRCAPGGAAAAELIGKLLSKSGKVDKVVAVVKCAGGSKKKFEYSGISSCSAARLVYSGPLVCEWGCLGFGDCVRVCPFNAIFIKDGVAVVDSSKCTGCGLCVEVCPQKIIELIPAKQRFFVACSNHGKTEVRQYCKNGCFACGICVSPRFNPDGIAEMKENLPVILRDKVADAAQLAKAGEKCPVNAWKEISG
ncbi:MAG: RnfABCDGE type electron transport complex subunit B [Elusimicrobia bacterium]|nr:RnfABCDGE type electron transport complex subunit B [Elusimicrobiota bacterium]